MSKVGDHFFEFPASRGTQGVSIVLMLSVPARTLTRVIASDNYGDTLERSQRELNPTGIELASVRSLVVRVRQNDIDKKVCKKLCIGSKSV